MSSPTEQKVGRDGRPGEYSRLYEEYAYVLDYLPQGRTALADHRRFMAPMVQVVGESYLTLLEAELRPGAQVAVHERLYIGKEKRDKVNRIVGRIGYPDLTASAKSELLTSLEKLIVDQETRFVFFFNNSQAITSRMHALELLPGVGKKIMWQIINARERKPFESFKDIAERAGIGNPVKLIAKRIVLELSEGGSKYRIFSRAFRP